MTSFDRGLILEFLFLDKKRVAIDAIFIVGLK